MAETSYALYLECNDQLLEDARKDYNADQNENKRKDITTFLSYEFYNKAENKWVKAHTTITYLGDLPLFLEEDGKKVISYKNALFAFDCMAKQLKSEESNPMVKVSGHGMFGPKKNIPVLLVDLQARYARAFDRFHINEGKPEPGMGDIKLVPNYHVSLKFDDMAFMRETPIGTIFQVKDPHYRITGMGMKRLGNCEPFYFCPF